MPIPLPIAQAVRPVFRRGELNLGGVQAHALRVGDHRGQHRGSLRSLQAEAASTWFYNNQACVREAFEVRRGVLQLVKFIADARNDAFDHRSPAELAQMVGLRAIILKLQGLQTLEN